MSGRPAPRRAPPLRLASPSSSSDTESSAPTPGSAAPRRGRPPSRAPSAGSTASTASGSTTQSSSSLGSEALPPPAKGARKVSSASTSTDTSSEAPKRPGRPRKPPAEPAPKGRGPPPSSASSLTSSSEDEVPARRGPGRPRKPASAPSSPSSSSSESSFTASSSEDGLPARRGPGRPRKVAHASPRGRPRAPSASSTTDSGSEVGHGPARAPSTSSSSSLGPVVLKRRPGRPRALSATSATSSSSDVFLPARKHRGRPTGGKRSPLKVQLQAARSLAAPMSGKGTHQKAHSSLALLFRHLQALYDTGRVPDLQAFERFLMVFIAEAADLSHAKAAGGKANRDQEKANKDKEKALKAFGDCALSFVLGKKHASPKKGRGHHRQPGHVISLVYRDYAQADGTRTARGLPSASAPPFHVHLDPNPEQYACGLFPLQAAPPHQQGAVIRPDATVKKLFNRVRRFARRVATDLAHSLPPPALDPQNVAVVYNSKLSEPEQGVMQHLMEARHLLAHIKNAFPRARELLFFLETSLERILDVVHRRCEQTSGASACHPHSPNTQHPLPHVQEHFTAASSHDPLLHHAPRSKETPVSLEAPPLHAQNAEHFWPKRLRPAAASPAPAARSSSEAARHRRPASPPARPPGPVHHLLSQLAPSGLPQAAPGPAARMALPTQKLPF